MKIIKNPILTFIIGGILFSSITVFAVNTISADKITYTDKNNNETTVDLVLDDLYSNSYNVQKIIASDSKKSDQLTHADSGSVTFNSVVPGKYIVFVVRTTYSNINNIYTGSVSGRIIDAIQITDGTYSKINNTAYVLTINSTSDIILTSNSIGSATNFGGYIYAYLYKLD